MKLTTSAEVQNDWSCACDPPIYAFLALTRKSTFLVLVMCCALHSSTCCLVHCPVLDKEQVLFFICCIFLTIIYFVVILRPRFSQCCLSCTESSRPKWNQVVTCVREVLRSRFGLGQIFRALATTSPFLVLTNSLLAIVQLSRIIQSGSNRLHRVFKRFVRRCGSGRVTGYWFPAFWS